MKSIYYILLISLLGCTKAIDFELPEIEQTIVVEATVESGLPPRVILTNSQGYFEAIDSSILSNIFIHDADIVISDGIESFTLQEINFNGIYVYTSLDFGAIGQYGKTYSLTIQVNDKSIYSFDEDIQELIVWSIENNSNKQVIFHDKRISDKKIIFKAIPMQVEFYRVNDDWLFDAEKIRLTFVLMLSLLK